MPLKLCLVGAGHMGGIHAQKLARMKGVTLTRVIDPVPTCAETVATRCGVAWSASYKEALSESLDGVVIASTTETHYAIARDFLDAGVHVFVEKPITATPEEAKELIGLAREKGLVLQVGHLERFSPPFRKARKGVDDPLSLEAHRITVFTGRSTDIDVIHDLMIHDIDLVLSLKKSPIKRVSARGASVFTKKIDIASAHIEFEDGSVATLSASRASSARERSFKIVEKGKSFYLDLANGRMTAYEATEDGRTRTRVFKAARPDPVGDELRAFVKCIGGKAEDIVDGEAGLRALLLANRISAAIESEPVGGGRKSAIE
jgi:predicted dehydrogenase